MKEIANGIDKTIVNGTVTDPMGKDILLQGIGAFGPSYYQLQGWSKEESGEWQADETVLGKTEVTENGQIIKRKQKHSKVKHGICVMDGRLLIL